MRRAVGKSLLSFLLVGGAAVSVAVDANDSHLFNPSWHPHAVFHDVVLLGYLSLASVWALWLLWRRSAEPRVALLTAASVPAFFWGMFPVAWAFPGSSPAAEWGGDAPAFLDLTEADVTTQPPGNPAGHGHDHGVLDAVPLFPNEVLAVVIVLLTLLSVWLAWPKENPPGSGPPGPGQRGLGQSLGAAPRSGGASGCSRVQRVLPGQRR